ncbi:MAG: hypothetical protein QXU45_09130 [Candidatus Bathyarchaeia archaeon]
MKRLLAIALSLLLVLGVTLKASAYENIIVNGGFETGDFTGWTLAAASISDVYHHTGNYSCFLYGASYIQQNFSRPVRRGILVVWAYGPSASRYKPIYLVCEDIIVAGDSLYASSSDWYNNTITVEAYVDENLIEHPIVGIRFEGDSNNPYVIDDIAFYVLEYVEGPQDEGPQDEGQTTPPNWPPKPQPQPQPSPGDGAGGGWADQIVEAVRELIRRLLGNPTILLLLLIFAAIMAYYTLRRH